MNETGTFQGSGTQVPASLEPQRVELLRGQGEKVTTIFAASTDNRFPVRAADTTKTVVVRVNTDLLSKQKKIAEANASIRRRSRG